MKAKHLLQLDVLLKGVSPQVLADLPESLPALERLLTLSQQSPPFEGGVDAWLCRALGVPRQQDDPVAPCAAGGDGLAAEQGYWLCAAPVYFHLARDRMLLEAALPDVTTDEAGAIIASLNAHFPEMQFFAPHPQRWYVRLPDALRMTTTPLEDAIGQEVSRVFPSGDDARQWAVRLNELQMLLHQHPVNEARDAAGKLPVNSLWLWGGGVKQPMAEHPYAHVWGDGALLAGLGVHSLPATADVVLDSMTGRALLVLDIAELGWKGLEQQWLAPLEQALKRGRLAQLNLHIAHGGRVNTCTVTRGDCWKWLYRRFMRRMSVVDILRGD